MSSNMREEKLSEEGLSEERRKVQFEHFDECNLCARDDNLNR